MPKPSTASLQQSQLLKEKALELYARGQYHEAAVYLMRARDSLRAQGARREEAEVLNNLGVVQLLRGRWEEAAQGLEEARASFQEVGDLGGQGEALGNLGTLYRRRGDPERAVAALKEAAELLQRARKFEAAIYSYRAAARVRLSQGRWLEFLHFYDLSLACREKPSLGHRLLRQLVKIPMALLARGAT